MARVRNRTERDNEDLVRLYLEDIGRHQLLTKDDEARLAQDIEAGKAARETLDTVDKGLTRTEKRDLQRLVRKGEDAQRQFVQSNLRLVVSIAKRYQASGMPLLDLVQEGNLGLIHAVEKFDWRKGFKFSTYATWWIRQAIQRGIANAGRTIRLPVHAADNLARLQKERAGLEARLGRPATPRRARRRARPRARAGQGAHPAPRRAGVARDARSAKTARPSSATSSKTAAPSRRYESAARAMLPGRDREAARGARRA